MFFHSSPSTLRYLGLISRTSNPSIELWAVDRAFPALLISAAGALLELLHCASTIRPVRNDGVGQKCTAHWLADLGLGVVSQDGLARGVGDTPSIDNSKSRPPHSQLRRMATPICNIACLHLLTCLVRRLGAAILSCLEEVILATIAHCSIGSFTILG